MKQQAQLTETHATETPLGFWSAPTSNLEAQQNGKIASQLWLKSKRTECPHKAQELRDTAEALWSQSVAYYQRLFDLRGGDAND